MALSAHLEQLDSKHAQLDTRIEIELKHPAPDTILVTELKKQKLQLKQKIAEMRAG